MMRMFNLLAILGGSLLGLAMVATLFLIADVLFGTEAGIEAAFSGALLISSLWYFLPFARKRRERSAPDQSR
jgi:hypothetical protein